MPSITDAANHVLAAGVPVLFLDTCSILDVIRAPARNLANCVEAATELLALATVSPAQCSLIVGSFVPTEWSDHEQEVLDLLNGHLQRMEDQARHFHGLCTHLGIPLAFGQPQYGASGLVPRLHDLSRQILRASIALDSHDDTMSRAYNRVAITRRRPCRRGGELKDCTIFEECLEVCRQLHGGGFTRKMVFCSSNTDDYCAPGVTPHPDVANDCGAVGLVFTTSLPWAVHELKT
jgi:hypothetical protein